MPGYVLSCESTVDVPQDYLDGRDIRYVFFNYELGGTPYKDDFGQTNSPTEIYSRMLAGEDAKTSQVGIGEYVEYFEGFLEQGLDVLHVCLSSGISGTYDSALDAREQLAPKYPDRTITVIDSLCASAGYGLFVDRLADLRDEGASLAEVADFAYAHRLELQHWFFSTDLTFFVKGGRVSKAAGLVGGLLSICPLLRVDAGGHLAPTEKIRSKARAIRRIVDVMDEHVRDGRGYSGKVFISQSDCAEDARAVADLIEERFPSMDGRVAISDIGATIGVHTGPGTVALFFWGDRRVD